jgi:hypothetical protein
VALSFSQVAVTSSEGPLCTVPPGPCTVIITNGSVTAADIVYVGTGSGVSASNGVPVPAGAVVPVPCLQGSPGGVLYAVGVASTPVGVIISTSR